MNPYVNSLNGFGGGFIAFWPSVQAQPEVTGGGGFVEFRKRPRFLDLTREDWVREALLEAWAELKQAPEQIQHQALEVVKEVIKEPPSRTEKRKLIPPAVKIDWQKVIANKIIVDVIFRLADEARFIQEEDEELLFFNL